jgi:acetoin utilization deacetylase AcuC-like enzyme
MREAGLSQHGGRGSGQAAGRIRSGGRTQGIGTYMSTLYLSHTACFEHDTGDLHPERVARLHMMESVLRQPDFGELVREEPPAASRDVLHLVHDEDYVHSVEEVLTGGPPEDMASDGSTPYGTWNMAPKNGAQSETDARLTKALMSTLYLSHPCFLDHETGAGHPERPDRLRAVEKVLSHEMFAALLREEAPLGSLSSVRLAHNDTYVQSLDDVSPSDDLLMIDADTVMSPGTWDAALHAVGAVVSATDAVMTGRVKNAFCAVRPPGHHAEANRAYGFCFFNNIAIAALHARVAHGAERVAVIDFDLHHGNGTQAIFWRHRDLFYASTHQMPLFPGTGDKGETGAFGNIVNAPLHAGDDGYHFRDAFTSRILPALHNFGPDIVLISAGFDAHRDDPLGSLGLVEDDYAWVTAKLLDVADKHAGGRIVSALEGGYQLTALARSAGVHVRELMKASR